MEICCPATAAAPQTASRLRLDCDSGLPVLAGRIPAAYRLDQGSHVSISTKGSQCAGLRSILATLAANGVPGTFFLTGNWVNQFPSDPALIYNAGTGSPITP